MCSSISLIIVELLYKLNQIFNQLKIMLRTKNYLNILTCKAIFLDPSRKLGISKK